jgi:glycosyltransferase involved in cell wall biosynthesis
MPIVSVILNTYNSAKFLQETLATVFEQTLTDFELLIVDDGSQDDTLAIARTYNDPRIQIHTYRNGGIAKSRNRGLALAQGEFIAFLDHDDRWHPHKLSTQLQVLIDSPKAAFVYSWITAINEAGEELPNYYPAGVHEDKAYPKLLVRNFIHTASNPLLRRSCAVDIGGFDEHIYGADDWDLWIRLAAAYEVRCSPHNHVQYRLVEGSGSTNVTQMAEGATQVIRKAFATAPVRLQSLQNWTWGYHYQYLCLKQLENISRREQVLETWQYLQQSRRHQPRLWPPKMLLKVLLLLLRASIWPGR